MAGQRFLSVATRSVAVMSINPLPAAARAVEVAERVEAWIDELNAAPLWPLGEPDLLALAVALARTSAKLAATQLHLTAEIDTRGAAISEGAPHTASWLRANTRTRPGSARSHVALATALDQRYPTTAEALAAGSLSPDHAAVITRTLDDLPSTVDDPTRDAAERELIEHAGSRDPRQLATLARHLAYCLDPDGEQALAREERRMADTHHLSLTHRPSGWWDLEARLDPETGATLRSLLDPHARPRPSSTDGPDPRTPGRRHADAFRELLATIPGDHATTSSGQRPCLIVTIPLATLQGRAGTGPATLPDSQPLSAATARRLACDSELIPAVLGSEGQPLDLGRSSYAPSSAQRRAVLLRDRNTCSHPHCDSPARHIHHIHHWVDGGPTDLGNLTALCGHHHRGIHRPDPPWSVTRGDPPQWTRNTVSRT